MDDPEEEDDTEAAGNKPKTRKQRRKEKEAKAAVAARGRTSALKKKNQGLLPGFLIIGLLFVFLTMKIYFEFSIFCQKSAEKNSAFLLRTSFG